MQKEEGNSLLYYIIWIVAVILIIKLFSLQVLTPEYKLKAANNVIKRHIVTPDRGYIIDRNGKLMVYNEAVYDLYVQANQLNDLDTLAFCDLVNISLADFRERIAKVRKESSRKSLPFIRQLTQSDFAYIHEHLHDYPGFSFEVSTVRSYPYNSGAHILGYISEVDQARIDASNKYYSPGDYVGMTGLEVVYENYLRGVKGLRNVIVDVFNNPQGSYLNGEEDVPAISGHDILTGIDIDLQKYGEELMKNKLGSVVAIDPKTGEILAYISSPSYNPNQLTGRYRGNNFRALLNDKNKPLFNRPINATYPPGSTFKPIMSLIAFQEGVKDPEESYSCIGGYQIPGHFVKCHEHTPIVTGRDAIRFSCNAYYCDVFRKVLQSNNYNSTEEAYIKWLSYLHSFGIGVPVGIDLYGEKKGNAPSNEYYNKLYGKKSWKATTIISLAIGQGEMLTTPLQLANSTAIIANKGYFYTPHIVKSIRENGEVKNLEVKKHYVDIEEKYFDQVILGMEDVLTAGTGRSVYDERIQMCGKTGTAQNPHGKDHSLFVSFAPKDNPKIVIAVVVENAGFGSTYAAPIASLMTEMYMFDSIADHRKHIEQRILEANLLNP